MWARALVSIVLCVVLCVAPAIAAAVVPGEPAPDFTLQDVNGTSYRLSDYRGRAVLLALIGFG
jgi:cytochrome oxidase Cu insertion factor (SCO1/SenC/PrrC family)